eukprot:gene16992-22489_t
MPPERSSRKQAKYVFRDDEDEEIDMLSSNKSNKTVKSNKRKSISDSDDEIALDDSDSSVFDSDIDEKKKNNKKILNKNSNSNKTKSPKKSPSKQTNNSMNKSSSDSINAKPVELTNVKVINNISSNIVTSTSYLCEDITKGGDITSDASAKKAILKYFQQQNRPYSAIQVYDNFHKRIAKSMIERALSSLSGETGSGGELCCKEYGKSKIYYVNQATMPSNYTVDDIDTIENEIDELNKTIDDLHQNEKSIKQIQMQLESEPADSEMENVIQLIESRLQAKEQRVKTISEMSFNPNDLVRLVKKHNSYRTIWKNRKEICIDIIDSIVDSSNKKPKDIINEIGLETDEEVSLKIPSALSEPKK